MDKDIETLALWQEEDEASVVREDDADVMQGMGFYGEG